MALYRARNIDQIRDDLVRQRNRKILWTIILFLLFVSGSTLTTQVDYSPVQFVGAMMWMFSGVTLFVYALATVTTRFSSGFSKTEKLNWLLCLLCKQLERYIGKKGRDFSRYWTRWYLYKIPDLFPDWSWNESKGDAYRYNDLFQEAYLIFSHSLKRVLSLLNYSLIHKKTIPGNVLTKLKGLRGSLDEPHTEPSRKQMQCLEEAASDLSAVNEGKADDGWFFGLRGARLAEHWKEVFKSGYIKIIIGCGIGTILFLGGVTQLPRDDVTIGDLLVTWATLMVAIVGAIAAFSKLRGT